MSRILNQQYDWIQSTRKGLFDYCEQITLSHYVTELQQFGGTSIRNLQAHIADCYRFWLGCFALKRQLASIRVETVQNVQDMREVFMEIDGLVKDFLIEFGENYDIEISAAPSWQEEHVPLSPLWLFTHTTTHEFHHKGQVVSMSRQLGYIPVMTDLYHPTRPLK